MQTRFAPEHLEDPDLRQAERILRTCVHCGFCNATCPTYTLLGDERDGPRGRIYLIKDMLENGRAADATVATHIDRCLSCLACTTTCPSGVDYHHLVDQARIHIERTYRRPLPERLLRWALPRLMARPRLFAAAMRLGRLARPLRDVLPARLRPMLAAVPRQVPGTAPRSARFPAQGARRMRVALLPGCVQPVLAPQIDEAAIRLLSRLGAEIVIAEGSGCCGALAYHLGQTEPARALAARNVSAWARLMTTEDLDAVIVTASGCGTMVKDYGHVLRGTPHEIAARDLAARARDITEVIAELGLGDAGHAPPLRVAYHSACSLQHGQKIDSLPRRLLAEAGFTLVAIPEGHLCCGSAGTYSLLQPELSARLRARKAANIEAVAPDVVAAGNFGCLNQIAGATSAPVVHIAALLDWATGGPVPAGLEALAATAPRPAAPVAASV